MPSSTIALLKAQNLSNPIPGLLELIPYSESLLDVALLDDLTMVMLKCGYKSVSNSLVVILLLDLAKVKLIKLQEVTFPSILGKALLIQRNIDGKQGS
jgi:hypothetical protein